MSTDEPAPSPDARGEPRTEGRRPHPVAERSYLSLVPWRNLVRALFLLLALGAVVALKRSGGGFLRNVLDTVAPGPPAATGPETTVHLNVGSPAR